MDLQTLRAFESQHRVLLRRRASVEQELSALADLAETGGEARGTLMRAMSLLTALRRELREHFELEEQSGLLTAATQAAPRLSRRASRLREEHEDMEERVSEILDTLLASRAAPERWPELADSFARFSDALRGHEQAEEALVRRAFMDDLGGGD